MVELEVPVSWWCERIREGLQQLRRQLGQHRIVLEEALAWTPVRHGRIRGVVYRPIFGGSPERKGSLHITLCSDSLTFFEELEALREGRRDLRVGSAYLVIGLRALKGHLEGYACPYDGFKAAIDRVVLTGPGMERMEKEAQTERVNPWQVDAEVLFSRSRGALGDDAWQRLTSDTFCIVGCGRHGSLMADNLANMGVRALTLVDPDVVDVHSIDGMGLVALEQVDHPKARAVADALEQRYPWCRVTPVVADVATLEGIQAIREADVVISCVDNAAALLTLNGLVAVYGRPVLVILGSRIAEDAAGRDVGCEVQLLYPHQYACCVCFGGVPDLHRVRHQIHVPVPVGHRPEAPEDFRQQRLGSLRAVASLTVGLAGAMIGNVYRGDGPGVSHWTRMTFEEGIPRIETTLATSNASFSLGDCLCPLHGCNDLAPFQRWLRRSRISFSRRFQ